MDFSGGTVFSLNPMALAQGKVIMASIHLRGELSEWYRWLHNSMGDLAWNQFSRALCKRFGSRKNLDPMSAISKLVQTVQISAYISQFETMGNLVRIYKEAHQVDLFLFGTKNDV
ncbi:hypothetical protein IFM89_022377 [Coptis chinensis]|uniref:Retrotransposon gag domain-containing protein n=1 Tax=Coptis chinensis TaxID=261450 RepID=A0A835IZA3_9MAGN|nr:hypothetical protein IFM89_022377 [Coptis chinensis]